MAHRDFSTNYGVSPRHIAPIEMTKRIAKKLLEQFRNAFSSTIPAKWEYGPRRTVVISNQDYWRLRAAAMFGVPYEEVTKTQRAEAKRRHCWEAYSQIKPL